MKSLIDMNLTPAWVPFLQQAGHEAVHWRDVGRPDAPDRALLERASAEQAVLLTQDLDFGTLLALGGATTPSVIQFRAQALLPADIGGQLLSAVREAEPHLAVGALVTVDPAAHRVTLLPIRPLAGSPDHFEADWPGSGSHPGGRFRVGASMRPSVQAAANHRNGSRVNRLRLDVLVTRLMRPFRNHVDAAAGGRLQLVAEMSRIRTPYCPARSGRG